MAATYEGSVEQVYRALADEQYWTARLADSGADAATLDSLVRRPDGGIDIATTQVLGAHRLPSVITRFYRGDLNIERAETWGPLRDDRAAGSITGSVVGAPATVGATMTLEPAGARARQEVTVTVEVRIPLVGGKIEDFIGQGLLDLLSAEQRFTSKWIQEHD